MCFSISTDYFVRKIKGWYKSFVHQYICVIRQLVKIFITSDVCSKMMVLETYITILGRGSSPAAPAGGGGVVSDSPAAPAGGGCHPPPPPPAGAAEVSFNLLLISHTFVSYYYCIEYLGKCCGVYYFLL